MEVHMRKEDTRTLTLTVVNMAMNSIDRQSMRESVCIRAVSR